MKTQRGYTLIETLVAMLILVMLSASGLYGWQYWQQSQRLWQTASQARDYLLYLREDANWHNRDHSISVIREGTLWCLVSSAAGANTCHGSSPLVFVPRWPEVEMSDLTPSLAFFGLRNTAWAGHIRFKNSTGEWWLVVSPWGRLRPARRLSVQFSSGGCAARFFAELAGALAALAGRKGFAWMRAVRLIGGLRRHLDPAYEYTLVERGQHMRGQLGGYLHDTEVVLDIDSADAPPRDAALAGYGAHQCAGGDVMRLPHINVEPGHGAGLLPAGKRLHPAL